MEQMTDTAKSTVKADGTILCDDFAGVTLNGTGSISLEGHTFDTR